MLNQHFDHGLMQCILTDPILEQSHCYQCVFHTLMLYHYAMARVYNTFIYKYGYLFFIRQSTSLDN